MIFEYTENGKTFFGIFLDGEEKQRGFDNYENAATERDKYFSDENYFDIERM